MLGEKSIGKFPYRRRYINSQYDFFFSLGNEGGYSTLRCDLNVKNLEMLNSHIIHKLKAGLLNFWSILKNRNFFVYSLKN